MKYFPYLRGKQFELIALREMCSITENTSIISPIIEPVKKIGATLLKTLDCLIEKNINFNLILNPKVGDIDTDYDTFINTITSKLKKYSNYQPSFIINEQVNISLIIDFIKKYKLNNISLICIQQPKNDELFDNLLKVASIKYAILQDDSSVRRLSRKIRPYCSDFIFLADHFNIKTKNVEYDFINDEFFSEDHLFFEEEGYQGFADYLTIGSDFKEGGFLPYAVAIHLTYFDENQAFRIRHFVSNSNEDNADTPGKFAEALAKLIPFINDKKIDTYACNQFREIYDKGLYPGLGSVKKLSILNHIELVYRYFTK